jgi:DNA-binding PadR family transcriptional regulator
MSLYASKAEVGLFPNTSTAKPAAQKCLTDRLIRVIGTDTKGKTPRELYGLSEKGWEFLLEQVNPKQVLEDFVRVLEHQQGEVGELLATARSMAESLQGLKDAVARVLPTVSAARLPAVGPEPVVSTDVRQGPSRFREEAEPIPTAVAVFDPPRPDLAPRIMTHLAEWSGAVGEDCPLPELFRTLSGAASPPTIGEFHDCLRRLHTSGVVYLHPWTGPLYALPEPAYALLVGHNVAYYVSRRTNGIQDVDSEVQVNQTSVAPATY